ncbi:MAG: LPS export ABC transporter periplasmic protein LptC [Legionellales bacterium]|jgi:lipopolysaccharide export system protein LptC
MKRFVISVAVFMSAAWLILQVSSQNTPLKPPAPTQYVEWFGKNIILTEMDTQGHLKQRITAQTLKHYVPDNITDLSQVDVQVFSNTEQPHEWQLKSDKGRLFHGEKKQDITRIDLWHHVELVRPENATESTVTINTSTLAIFPDKEYAHTDQFAVVKQEGQQMSGDGMEIFFPTQKFYLLNNVSSTHDDAS